jgi:hypothetical protein
MRSVVSPRKLVAAFVVVGVVLGLGSIGVSGAATRATAAAKPPKTVTATLITRRKGTLATGSSVRAVAVSGQRVFTDAKHGLALASVGSAQYAVATADGGKTWKTYGPALHLNAAQAPLSVSFIGAVSRKTVFAWGGGQVIDGTNDGGKHWYSALFTTGSPVAVVRDIQGHITAFVGSPSGGSTSRYVSKDGGRTWHLA